jgi:hypothetical protein
MVWAPDSTDLWAPDSGRPDLWASDSRGHLTLGRAVELFLGAKADEGASPRTIEWYRMVTVRLVRAGGPRGAAVAVTSAESASQWRSLRRENLRWRLPEGAGHSQQLHDLVDPVPSLSPIPPGSAPSSGVVAGSAPRWR